MVKEKPNSTRIYDKDGFRRRAACICVRSEAEAEVCFFYLSKSIEFYNLFCLFFFLGFACYVF